MTPSSFPNYEISNKPRTVQVELATLEWVWWFNNQRLHSELDYRTPAEVEAEYFAENTPVLATATHGNTSEQNPGRFEIRRFPSNGICQGFVFCPRMGRDYAQIGLICRALGQHIS
jgi:hypothetical protein